MDDEYIRKGGTYQVTATDEDLTAQTITMTISDETEIKKQETASFENINGKMIATISFEVDFALGEYQYMFTVNYEDFVAKFPEVLPCSQECELPKFIVCEANDEY